MRIAIRYALYFERFSIVLGHFPKASCAKYLLVAKATFLRKWASTLALRIFSIFDANKIKGNTENLTEKCHNSLFLRDQTQITREVSNTFHVCINGGFKLLLLLLFIICDNLKGELLLWTTTVVLRNCKSNNIK